MIRTVLAVAVAAALVGASLPAIDAARVRQSERTIQGELAGVERAATALLTADETTPGAGARRTVTVSIPAGSWRGADVDALTLRGGVGTSGQSTAVYRIDRGGRRTTDLDAPLYTPSGSVEVGDGARRLTLTLVAVDGRRAIRIRPARTTPPEQVGTDRSRSRFRIPIGESV